VDERDAGGKRKTIDGPIQIQMDHGVWTFVRGADRLEISREDLDDGTVLAIAGDGEPRSYFFREADRLETFQKDMETLLLKTGWSFVSYAPDKRAGSDRRGWPRRSNDRRRWWTDGTRSKRAKAGTLGTETAKTEKAEKAEKADREDRSRTSEK